MIGKRLRGGMAFFVSQLVSGGIEANASRAPLTGNGEFGTAGEGLAFGLVAYRACIVSGTADDKQRSRISNRLITKISATDDTTRQGTG